MTVHLEAVSDLNVLDLVKAEFFLEDVAVKIFILHVQRLFVDNSTQLILREAIKSLLIGVELRVMRTVRIAVVE